MGEALRCTRGALLIDESVGSTETCSGTADNPEACPDTTIELPTTYECTAGSSDCPPIADSSGGDTTSPSPTDTSDNGGSGESAGGNGKGKSFGGSGPDECAYVEDLPYCASNATDGGVSDGSCEKGSCAPGQAKKSEHAGGSSSNPGRGHFKCKKDKKGNATCEQTPECAPGTHASECGACVADGDSSDCVSPADGGCWVTGGGFIVGANITTGAAPDGHDNFGGNAKPMKDGRIQGHWNHVDHGTGNHAKGKPEYIVCRHVDEPGPGQPGGKKGFTMNQVYFGGPAEWRSNGTWATGYWFDVVAKDHGEPGSVPHAKNGFMPDTYHFTVRLMDDVANKVSGAIVYETSGALEGGNIQMHPPNGGHPYTPMSLPDWVAFEP
jgi:hypothetical protein